MVLVRQEAPDCCSESGSATVSTRARRVADMTGEIIRRITDS